MKDMGHDILDAMRPLFESLTDGICLVDAKGAVLYTNRAARGYLGRARTSKDTRSFCDFFCKSLVIRGDSRPGCCDHSPPESCPRAVTFHGSLPPRSSEHARSGDPGAEPELRVRCMSLQGSGWHDRRLIHIEDISNEVEFERRQQEWRDMVAHDMRSPLTNVLGALRMIEEIPVGSAISEHDMELVRFGVRSCLKIRTLVDEYLEVVRVEAGRLEVRMACVNAARLARETVAEFGEAARLAGVELRLDIPDTLHCDADIEVLTRALQNLIDNALKFTPKDGRVTVSIHAKGDEVLISVTDSGHGISTSDLPHIFDRYYQGSTPGRRKGLGLGLTFCREALEAIGGSVSVESEFGRGTTFTMRLSRSAGGPGADARRL